MATWISLSDARAQFSDGQVISLGGMTLYRRPCALVRELIASPAVVGECHHLPSGTVHALGAGVLVAEIQTPSDTAFRLYDWGRTGRPLQVEEAVACADCAPPPQRIVVEQVEREARAHERRERKADGRSA